MSVRRSMTARTRSFPSLFAFADSLASFSSVDSPPSKTMETSRLIAPFLLYEIEGLVGVEADLVAGQRAERFLSKIHQLSRFTEEYFPLGKIGLERFDNDWCLLGFCFQGSRKGGRGPGRL